MNRRRFLQGIALSAPTWAALTHPFPVHSATSKAASLQTVKPAPVSSNLIPSANIRDFLSDQALRLTRAAALRARSRSVIHPDFIAQQRARFLEMMGVDHLLPPTRPTPPSHLTGVIQRPLYRIEKLHYESLPNLHVTANLYLPQNTTGPVPGVLYVCGHSNTQKHHYQAHARKFAELGMACLIVDTIQLGEAAGYHHGCYREGWWHWYSRGYTPAGIEMLNGIRGLDLLSSRPEIHPQKLGVTGISGGGAATWWIAAADPRVQVAAPVCGTATLFSPVHDRTVDGHCDCMWWINSHLWDLGDLATLIAPRPLMIASANADGIFTIESIREVHAQTAQVYRRHKASHQLRLIETPGGHSYHPTSRTAIFSWFAQHLQNRSLPPDQIGDITPDATHGESLETLRVYSSGTPPQNISPTIHDHLFQTPHLPQPTTAQDVQSHRARVVQQLRSRTFGAFPTQPPQLQTELQFGFEEDVTGWRFAFTSEVGWRLHGEYFRAKNLPETTPAPAVVRLQSPQEGRYASRQFHSLLPKPWHQVSGATRGTGDTAWSDDLQWHLRRAAAWTGRTIPSMRVWDTLRLLQTARTLPHILPDQIALAARGEMAAVALYAALLDGRIQTLILEDPPASQNLPGNKDGKGPMLEMLQCLRITDLHQVAALLWPCELVFVGSTPDSYSWTESVYHQLNSPHRFHRVASLRDWKS